jgi:hypothetical protein
VLAAERVQASMQQLQLAAQALVLVVEFERRQQVQTQLL